MAEYAVSIIIKRDNGDVLTESWALSESAWIQLRKQFDEPHISEFYNPKQVNFINSMREAFKGPNAL